MNDYAGIILAIMLGISFGLKIIFSYIDNPTSISNNCEYCNSLKDSRYYECPKCGAPY
jgi:anaerobic ribonucleoside-triphosphate reductase